MTTTDGAGLPREQTSWDADRKMLLGLPARFWFWTILLLGFVVMQVIHNEISSDAYAGGASVFVIVVGAILISLFTGLEFLPAMLAHWKRAAVYLILFLLVGVGYVGIRWSVKMWQWSSAYETALVNFKKERNITDPGVPAGVLGEWQRHYTRDRKVGPWPNPLSHEVQQQARRWFVAWPWSLLQWALGDLFNTIIDWIMNFLTKMMVAITDYFTAHLPGVLK